MGVTQGWLALALMATGAAPPPAAEKPQPEITYTIGMAEARGLAWRDATDGLAPVVQHGSVSVWTAPADFLETIVERGEGVLDEVSEIKGRSLSPAHLTTKKNQSFVTKVSWRGEGKEPRRMVENVREGVVATVIGRKLDQGVLAQLVIEDTDIRAVHAIDAPAPRRATRISQSEAKPRPAETAAPKSFEVAVTASMDPPADVDADVKIAEHREAEEFRLGWIPSKAAVIVARIGVDARCEGKPGTDEQAAKAAWTPATTAQIQVPEIGRAQAAGEWLIPEDGVLVIGFGPHTVGDADGRAVVRERLAIITAEVADAAPGEVDDASDSEPFRHVPAAEPEPLDPDFQSVAPVPPRTATAIPALPSRTLPRGVHADGRPATLPPLPEDDEAHLAAPADDSSKPRPSPQSRRKPSTPPEPAATDKPAADDEPAETPDEPPATTKRKIVDPDAGRTSFVLPAAFSAITTLSGLKPAATSFSAPFQGAQFLVPLKPLAVKLPLNQKLEFELLGRIVADEPPIEARIVAGN